MLDIIGQFLMRSSCARARLSAKSVRVGKLCQVFVPALSMLCWLASYSNATPLLLTPTGNLFYSGFDVAPDGYIYTPGRNANILSESDVMYRIPLTGSGSESLSVKPTASNFRFSPFVVSPDNQRIVFRYVSSFNGDVYTIPKTGGSMLNLSNSAHVVGGINSTDIWLTPSGDRVMYLSESNTSTNSELYSAPVDGSAAPVKLNGTIFGAGEVDFVTVTPDGNSVLYTASQETSSRRDLYRASPTGGGSTRINTTLGVGDRLKAGYKLSPTGQYVVYGNGARIYRKDVVGGSEVSLTPSLTSNFDDYFISPGGTRVLYVADTNADGRKEILSVAASGGTPAVFTGLSSNNPSVDYLDVVLGSRSGGSDLVAFRTQDSDGKASFYSASVDGGPATLLGRLSPPAQYFPPFRMQFSPDGSDLMVQNNSSRELYSYPTAGGTPQSFGNVDSYLLHPDGKHLVYVKDDGAFQRLYWESLDRSEPVVDLMDGMTPKPIAGFDFTSDGKNLVFKVGQGTTANYYYLTALPTTQPGDFNGDGHVDAADYAVWRKNGGTSADYSAWRSHFGTNGAGSGTTELSLNSLQAVPEPVAYWLMAAATCALTIFRVPRLQRSYAAARRCRKHEPRP